MAQWSDALKVLGGLAPSIATVFGGPLAGTAVSALEGVLGVHPKAGGPIQARQDAIAGVVASATPEQLLAIKQADQDFALKMADLGYKDVEALAALNVKDRDSARQREISVKDWTPRLLAGGVTAGFFGVLTFMLVKSVPDASKSILDVMLGSLGTAWISIISYYFGSSASSAEKTQLLAKAQPIK